MDRDLYERWMDEQAAKFPDHPREHLGGFYKSEGVVPFESATSMNATTVYTESGEGPYYIGNGAPIPPRSGWTVPARYDWTWPIQLNVWRGGMDTYHMISDLWAARGDAPTLPNPNLATLREFLEAHFDESARRIADRLHPARHRVGVLRPVARRSRRRPNRVRWGRGPDARWR